MLLYSLDSFKNSLLGISAPFFLKLGQTILSSGGLDAQNYKAHHLQHQNKPEMHNSYAEIVRWNLEIEMP